MSFENKVVSKDSNPSLVKYKIDFVAVFKERRRMNIDMFVGL